MSSKRPTQKNGVVADYNIALLGALGVGKSALTVKYITKRFIMEYDPFIEDTYTKHEDLDSQEFLVHVMDTCDKEDSDPARYLRWADAFMVVYSITDRSSFDKSREYLATVAEYLRTVSKECPTALVGNKIDLERYRQVSKADGQALASEFDGTFYETTAAEEFEYVEDVFHGLVHAVQRERGERSPSFSPLFITEDKYRNRPRSPRITSDKKEDKGSSKKNTSSFKLFNKSFKIFN